MVASTDILDGAAINLTVEGGLGNYTWSDIGIQGYGSMSDRTGASTSISMNTNGVYQVEVTGDVLGGEIAIDGDLEEQFLSMSYTLKVENGISDTLCIPLYEMQCQENYLFEILIFE